MLCVEYRVHIKDVVTIVNGSRLVYRKGVDLVVKIIPIICKKKFVSKRDNREVRVNFVIAGDGPKRILLEEMIEKHRLQDRVEMLGELQQSQVRDQLLVRGQIFLNTSLTEAFCMAIVEAASCGLKVVSTGVGGIPEVLPGHMIHLVQPSVTSIVQALVSEVKDVIYGKVTDPHLANKFVAEAYNWKNDAERTGAAVYNNSVTEPELDPSLGRSCRNLWECRSVAGPLMAMVYLAAHYFILILNWLRPL